MHLRLYTHHNTIHQPPTQQQARQTTTSQHNKQNNRQQPQQTHQTPTCKHMNSMHMLFTSFSLTLSYTYIRHNTWLLPRLTTHTPHHALSAMTTHTHHNHCMCSLTCTCTYSLPLAFFSPSCIVSSFVLSSSCSIYVYTHPTHMYTCTVACVGIT